MEATICNGNNLGCFEEVYEKAWHIRIEKYWIKFLSEGDTLDVSKIDFYSNYIIITIMILTIFLPLRKRLGIS